mgnify:CR=1 FL=1
MVGCKGNVLFTMVMFYAPLVIDGSVKPLITITLRFIQGITE